MLTRAVNMSPELTFVRITKLRELSGSSWKLRGEAPAGATCEGSPNHLLAVGYVIDGWFLETPRVGRSMVVLRFRRNSVHRIGVFTSSAVTFIGDTEIQTVNSVYQIENRAFDQSHLPAD
jgi:hypothetical protein